MLENWNVLHFPIGGEASEEQASKDGKYSDIYFDSDEEGDDR